MIALLVLMLQETRDVLLSDRPVEVRVPVSTDREHRSTVVSFPEESLEALVAGWNEGDLSVERRRENLFIKLLRKSEGDLHVLGASGTLYRLRIVPAEGPPDGRVRLQLPKEARKEAPEPVDLLRSMRLGRRPAEGSVLRASEPVYRSAEVDIRTAYVYDSASCRGYVLRVENLAGEPRRLDPSRFVGKNLLLAGYREMLVGPGESTLLYLVFAKIP